MDQVNLEQLEKEAYHILQKNDQGTSTIPAAGLYPHQWNWDSAFIALGLNYFDEARAQQEILSLLAGQWKNGMIPHIIFNPQAGDPNWEHSNIFYRVENHPQAPAGKSTSGITQPPVLAFIALEMYHHSRQREKTEKFLKKIFPRLKAYHDFFLTERSIEGEFLPYLIHPWESGLDDSPRWDEILSEIEVPEGFWQRRSDTKFVPAEQRNTDQQGMSSSYLVKITRDLDYKPEAIRKQSPFLVQPVLFDTIFCLAHQALAWIAEIIGEDSQTITRQQAQAVKQAIQNKLWDEEDGRYYDYDLRNKKLIKKDTITSYCPLLAGIPSPQQAEILLNQLTDPDKYWPESGYPLATVSMQEPEFERQRYWRGPVWVNINWFMIKGLAQYGFHKQAEQLTERTLEMVSRGGFHEYFDPFNARGYGAKDFSWTASLIIDLIERKKKI